MKSHCKECYLICYDIEDDAVRRRIVKILSNVGFRVQKSVFEATITVEKYQLIVQKMSRLIDKTDSIRIYLIQGIQQNSISLKVLGHVSVSYRGEDVIL